MNICMCVLLQLECNFQETKQAATLVFPVQLRHILTYLMVMDDFHFTLGLDLVVSRIVELSLKKN